LVLQPETGKLICRGNFLTNGQAVIQIQIKILILGQGEEINTTLLAVGD
jgi:hypothetical protein